MKHKITYVLTRVDLRSFSLSRSSQKGISDLYFALKRLLRGTYEKRNTAAQNLTDLIVGEFCLHFAI